MADLFIPPQNRKELTSFKFQPSVLTPRSDEIHWPKEQVLFLRNAIVLVKKFFSLLADSLQVIQNADFTMHETPPQ